MSKISDKKTNRTYHCPDWAYHDNVEPIWKFALALTQIQIPDIR